MSNSRMYWEKLLSRKRLVNEGKVAEASDGQREARSEFQRDYDRIIFSSAFRRLQDKAQVFPLAESDYVRTRLTHTLEVASVGRSIGKVIGYKVLAKEPYLSETPYNYSADDFGFVVAAACLGHDIGNPPFGHSGEDAISCWFKANPSVTAKFSTAQQIEDFTSFEGNAQGFRVLTRLQNIYETGGMQLTCATLGAFTKYPRESALSVPNSKAAMFVGGKKFGFFQQDKDYFRTVAQELGLIRRLEDCYWWARHPLAFLVEASDDICYTVIDLEDGFRLGIIPFDEIQELLLPLTKDPGAPKVYTDVKHDQKNVIARLRSEAITNLIFKCSDAFMAGYDEIMAGDMPHDLISRTQLSKSMEKIKEVSRRKMYRDRNVLQIELAGYEVLGDLLSTFVGEIDGGGKRKSKLEKILAEHGAAQNSSFTEYEKALEVTDFIAGMTDSYAVSFYRRLKGISLPRYI